MTLDLSRYERLTRAPPILWNIPNILRRSGAHRNLIQKLLARPPASEALAAEAGRRDARRRVERLDPVEREARRVAPRVEGVRMPPSGGAVGRLQRPVAG